MYVNTTAEVKAETDYCVTSSNAVQVVEHIYREHGADTEILFGPDMFLGAYVEKQTGRKMHVWDGECHVHAGIRPSDIADMRAVAPGRGLPDPPRVRVLDVGHGVRRGRRRGRRGRPHALDRRDDDLGRRRRPRAPRRSWPRRPGCCTRCRWRGPTSTSWPPTRRPSCRYMKMITLPKLRDTLRDVLRRREGARGDRRARAAADRADGRDRLGALATCRSTGRRVAADGLAARRR